MLSYSVGVEESSEASTVSSTSTEFTSVDQTTVSALLKATDSTLECDEAVSGETWSSPSGWTGPCPNLHYSFDVSNGLVLIEGNQEMGAPSIVSGKVTK